MTPDELDLALGVVTRKLVADDIPGAVYRMEMIALKRDCPPGHRALFAALCQALQPSPRARGNQGER